MQNDMGEGLAPLGPNDLEQVKSLWSDDEDAMMQRALRLSTHAEGDEAKPETLDYTPQSFGENFECRIRSGIPEFPTDRKIRLFRLFRPADILPTLLENRAKSVDVFAVSYCWPKEKVENKGKSVVRDLDGNFRPARALDDVLDRAVDFANSCGLRMIWIDQECLPQRTADSPQEDVDCQRLGVQAMDLVYNKAMVTAGLHDGIIRTQRQAGAIRCLIDHATRRIPVPNLSRPFFREIFGFLRTVRLDRWYTRARVFQEAISAGENLMLAFRKGKGALDTDPSRFHSELVIVPVNSFRAMVRSARAFYQQTFTASGTVVVREHTLRYPELDFAESLHPKLAFTNQIPLQVYGGNQHGRRQRVNASTALSFLKRREIVYQADQTTLVANMCGYEIRLDANEVAKQCNSVRIGILALALLIGDTSILDPGVYSFTENQGDETSGFNRPFLSPYDTDPGLIEDYTMMKGYLQMPRVCKHALGGNLTEGLRLPAYIWEVEREIDRFPLKEQFAEIWHNLKCLYVQVDRLKIESEEAFRQRENRARAHLSMGNRMNLARQEIFSLGYLAPDSIVWAGLDPDGIECRARLDAERVRRDPQMRQVVAEIFFGILLYLKTHSDADAAGLANSFWQSVRVDTIDNTRDGLPDEVNDALFNHRAVLDAPFETLKLDTGGFGGFRQTWLLTVLCTMVPFGLGTTSVALVFSLAFRRHFRTPWSNRPSLWRQIKILER
ncbi:putative heterokaryon incompatibility [Colletotrichum asianum]